MTAIANAGNQARTTSDASLPQNSSDGTCDDCEERDAEGVNADGRSLCRPCARRVEILIADGSGLDLESKQAELREAIEEIPDADPETLTLYEQGHGHFIINSDEDEQDVSDIDEALAGTGYQRDGIVNPPGMTQQNVVPTEGGDSDE